MISKNVMKFLGITVFDVDYILDCISCDNPTLTALTDRTPCCVRCWESSMIALFMMG